MADRPTNGKDAALAFAKARRDVIEKSLAARHAAEAESSSRLRFEEAKKHLALYPGVYVVENVVFDSKAGSVTETEAIRCDVAR